MTRPDPVTTDLFAADRQRIALNPGAWLLGGFALEEAAELLAAITDVSAQAPFRHLETPGGRSMSVAMTNSGAVGWVSDRRGYRYEAVDPLSGLAWPAMPPIFRDIATRAARNAGYENFRPDACLINHYAPGTRLSLHQDQDEAALDQPIISISLGVSATFLWGGQTRGAPLRRHALHHGDVVVWGGPARMTFHGIAPLHRSDHPSTGTSRFNLTFRRAAPSD